MHTPTSPATPQISFIIPVFNVEPYLAECLDSILKHPIHKEIIIIDDGSTDNSFQIAQQYFKQHPEIILLQQHNRGVSAARNMGLRLAKGEWLNFTDPDDFIIEPHIAQILELAKQNQVDVYKGMVQRSFEDGSSDIIIRPPECDGLSENAFVMMKGYTHFHMMLSKDWFPSANFGFYRTEFLRQNHFQFHEGLTMAEDSLWIWEILTCNLNVNVMEMGRLWYNYRIRKNSAVQANDNLRGVENMIHAGNIMYEKAQSHHPQQQALSDEEYQIHQQIYVDTLRMTALIYGICYRFIYQKCSQAGKDKVRHLFTPEIIAFMQQFLGYEVIL